MQQQARARGFKTCTAIGLAQRSPSAGIQSDRLTDAVIDSALAASMTSPMPTTSR